MKLSSRDVRCTADNWTERAFEMLNALEKRKASGNDSRAALGYWVCVLARYLSFVMHHDFDCIDCDQNTFVDEYYAIKNEVWDSVYPDDVMACIGCLEKRLNRRLTKKDFLDAPINQIFPQSARLKNRLAA